MDASTSTATASEVWPSLPVASWQDTYATLHMWTQVVGKIRLALAPHVNHWWQVPLYVTARGLTTSPMPYGTRLVQIDFDFLSHQLRIQTTDGGEQIIALKPQSVADFYAATMDALRSLDIDVSIWTTPVEIPNPIPFEQDTQHAAYEAHSVEQIWRLLAQTHRVFSEFRSRFTGKVSPVHFFWGSFDLAVTRFSGRRAPLHPGAPNIPDSVTREAYSHEVSSCGFWPGGGEVSDPVFYAYAYGEPEGFGAYPVQPDGAFYSQVMREFFLPLEVVRASAMPDETLLAFLQSTYEAAAVLGHWDREALERDG
jgi:hypothetical protein